MSRHCKSLSREKWTEDGKIMWLLHTLTMRESHVHVVRLLKFCLVVAGDCDGQLEIF